MRRTPTQKKLLLLIIAPVVFFGLLEIVLRLLDYSYDPGAAGAVSKPHGESTQVELYRRDPDLLWTLLPSTRIDNEGRGFTDVRTNSAGLRGPELPGPREADELRILCLGDSITFGLMLTGEQTLPALLERSLAAMPSLRGRRVRVISGAVPGWSAVQGLRLLDRLSALEPDLVVFWFGMNDSQPARVRPDSRLGSPGARVVHTTNILRSARCFQLVQSLIHSAWGSPEGAVRVSPEEFREVVQELRGRAAGGGPEVVFIRCPTLLDLAIEQTRTVIRRAKEEGVRMVYGPDRLLKPLQAAPSGTDLVGRVLTVNGEAALVFSPDRMEMGISLPALEADLVRLTSHRQALRANLATLPEDAVSPEELFGCPPRFEFFIDCCHLSPLGVERAADSLARIIAGRLD